MSKDSFEKNKQPLWPTSVEQNGADAEENGNTEEVSASTAAADEEAAEYYATVDRQRNLKNKIEQQVLPVKERFEELKAAIAKAVYDKGMLLFQGETGSGKSVYSPLAVREVLKELGLNTKTVMMQPRRDAASGIGRAAAALLDERLGESVGVSTSELRALSADTETAVVTPGIFLRYLQEGKLTKDHVGAIIIDELHEGSVEYHLALGLIKQMQERGEAPLVLLTSATMDKERVLDYFGLDEEDYLNIEGRSYEVKQEYVDDAAVAKAESDGKYGYVRLAADTVREVCASDDTGDILVFLPGVKEINECIRQIGDINGVEVLPLHRQLSFEDRDIALSGKYDKGIQRRVIVATNIAETSVTVPGVTTVIDSCRQRLVRYNPKTGIEELGTELISKDQAEQRAGRAGRIEPGRCIKLLTKDQYESLQQHPEYEINRRNLSHLVLQLKSMDIDPRSFPFYEQPDPVGISAGIEELQSLGALNADEELTELGSAMQELPFEPRLARMVIEGQRRGCLIETLVLAAFERESVLQGPSQKDMKEAHGDKIVARNKVQEIHKQFDRGGSDFLMHLNIYIEALKHGVVDVARRKQDPESRYQWNQFQRWCQENYLRPKALSHITYKVGDYVRYLKKNKRFALDPHIDFSELPDMLRAVDDDTLGSVILSAHPDNLLYLDYSGYGGLAGYRKLQKNKESGEINISPGSQAFDAYHRLIIARHIKDGPGKRGSQEIKRRYAIGVHPIGLAQVRELHPELINEDIENPSYNPATDQVEQIVKYYIGDDNNKVLLGDEIKELQGDIAVDVFAQALVDGEVEFNVCEHNSAVRQQLVNLYNRSGGKVVVPDLVAWYRERLDGAYTLEMAEEKIDTLRMDANDFCKPELQKEIDQFYPSTIAIKGNIYKIAYTYTEQSDNFQANIYIEPDDLLKLAPEDIPQLGKPGDNLQVQYSTTIAGYTQKGDTVASLQDAIDTYRITQAWHNWQDRPELKLVTATPFKSLPNPEELGYVPLPYTQDRHGNDVFAYPGLVDDKTRNQDGTFTQNYYVMYYASKEKAADSVTTVRGLKELHDNAIRQQQEQAGRIQPLQEKYNNLQAVTENINQNPARYGFGYHDVLQLVQLMREANIALQNDAQGIVSKDATKKSVAQLLQEVEVLIDKNKEVLQQKSELYSKATALRQEIKEVAVQSFVYGYYEDYGLDYAAFSSLSEQWSESCNILENIDNSDDPVKDLQNALEMLKTIKLAFGQAGMNSFSGAMAEALLASGVVPTEKNKDTTAVDEKSEKSLPLEKKEKVSKKEQNPDTFTEPERIELSESVALSQISLQAVRTYGKRVKNPETKKEKGQMKIYTDSKAVLTTAGALQQEIAAADAAVNVNTLRSKVGSLRADVENLSKQLQFIVDGYNKQWIAELEDAIQKIPRAIENHELAMDVINEGLLTKEEFKKQVLDWVMRHATAYIEGKFVKFDSVIDKIVEELTS